MEGYGNIAAVYSQGTAGQEKSCFVLYLTFNFNLFGTLIAYTSVCMVSIKKQKDLLAISKVSKTLQIREDLRG